MSLADCRIDRDDVLNMREVNGVIRSLTRRVRVMGADLAAISDYTALFEAKTIGDSNNIPVWPNKGNGITDPGNMLRVSERSFELVNPGTIDITIKYEHILDMYQQLNLKGVDIGNTKPDTIYGKMRTSVQQSKTNYYIDHHIGYRLWDRSDPRIIQPGQVVDYNGFFWTYIGLNNSSMNSPQLPAPYPTAPTDLWRLAVEADFNTSPTTNKRRQIAVGHTFPADDRNLAERTLYQTGEITIMQTHSTYTVKGKVNVKDPLQIVTDLVGKTNINEWLDGEIASWMCTEADFEVGESGQGYLFDFQWQYNGDTWDPTVVFIDSRTGRPPINLLQGFGSRSIQYHDRIDFEDYFNGALFEVLP